MCYKWTEFIWFRIIIIGGAHVKEAIGRRFE